MAPENPQGAGPGFPWLARLGKLVLILTIIAAIVLVSAWQWGRAQLEPVAPGSASEFKVEIPRSATSIQIADLLRQKGLIKNRQVFLLYLRFQGLAGKLQAGEYSLGPGLSLPELVLKLADGRIITYSFTVPEGFNLGQIAALLSGKGLAGKEKFLQAAASYPFSYPFLEGLPAGPKRLEGFLFPDTYRVNRDTGEVQIIEMMLRRFAQVYYPEIDKKASQLGLTTLQAVTLASLIEREARLDAERPLISGVFLRRLRLGMRLEADPSVQYALGEWKEELTRRDLEVDSPYNTYRNGGLPPGPIASPGRKSLEAAVNPEMGDYLYFVARPGGSHVFSSNLAQHNAAVRRYRP